MFEEVVDNKNCAFDCLYFIMKRIGMNCQKFTLLKLESGNVNRETKSLGDKKSNFV